MLFIIAIILVLVLIGMLGIISYLYFNKIQDKDSASENPFLKSRALFFIFMLISEVIFFSLIITSPVEERFLYWNNPNIGIVVFYRLSLITRAVGYAFIVSNVEKRVLHNKKPILAIIFLVIMISGQLMQLFAPPELYQFISLINILSPFVTALIPLGYIYIGIKSKGIVRTKALLVGIAFVLLLVATFAMTSIFLERMGAAEIIDINLIYIITVTMKICLIYMIFWGFK